jgi:F-type H+-transporting ATPase subunit delta
VSAANSVMMQIARPYASALFEVASEAKAIEKVETALDEFTVLIDESADFQRFLFSPVITHEQKVPIIDTILEKSGTLELVAKFVKTVARHGRLFALPHMITQFKELAAEGRGEMSAEVTSAAPLSKVQLKSLADTLKGEMGKTMTIETHVDPELIGGLVVKVGSRMIDSSLRTKLSAMKIAMKEVG